MGMMVVVVGTEEGHETRRWATLSTHVRLSLFSHHVKARKLAFDASFGKLSLNRDLALSHHYDVFVPLLPCPIPILLVHILQISPYHDGY